MRFINFEKIQADAKGSIDLVAGIYKGEPVYMAKQNSSREWTLYQSGGDVGQLNTTERLATIFQTLDDVLFFYRLKGVTPFCPKPDSPEAPPHQEPAEEIFDKRRHFRKPVRCNGVYRNHRTGSSGECLVEDISLGGVKFSTVSFHDLQPEDELHISFILDPPDKNVFEQKAAVRHVHRFSIGVNFLDGI